MAAAFACLLSSSLQHNRICTCAGGSSRDQSQDRSSAGSPSPVQPQPKCSPSAAQRFDGCTVTGPPRPLKEVCSVLPPANPRHSGSGGFTEPESGIHPFSDPNPLYRCCCFCATPRALTVRTVHAQSANSLDAITRWALGSSSFLLDLFPAFPPLHYSNSVLTHSRAGLDYRIILLSALSHTPTLSLSLFKTLIELVLHLSHQCVLNRQF